MRILYYYWNEFNGSDCWDAMRRLGYQVDVFMAPPDFINLTKELEEGLETKFIQATREGIPYDLIFSFNYFTNVSEYCERRGVKYISWVFDSPHKPLCAKNVKNRVNHIFLFDRALYRDMKEKGIDTVHFSPLAVNAERISELCDEIDTETAGVKVYMHDVCFLGNLYDDEFNFYDSIKSMPPELKAYIDAVIKGQEKVFGIDIFTDENIVNRDRLRSVKDYVEFERSGKFDINYDEVILDIMRKKVTVNERRNLLTEMGKRFDTTLYTAGAIRHIDGVNNMGRADYSTKMPRVFRRSKVNLNITLRTIRDGIPLRVLDVLAAGGFLVTSFQKEIADKFEDGKELVMAMTPSDMIEKVSYYLEHDDEREEIAANGQKKVFEDYSYMKLLPRILECNS